jgi:2'-5' RNA ligase
VDALLGVDLVPVRHPDRPYVPHLSICYYDDAYPTAAVAAAIEPYRECAFGDLWVDTIELVRIAGDGIHYPPMETVREILLGSAL